jgi:hypothetical protein
VGATITAAAVSVAINVAAAAMRMVMATPVLARRGRHPVVEHRPAAAARQCHSKLSSHTPVGLGCRNRVDAAQLYGSTKARSVAALESTILRGPAALDRR